jgi:uncharacterized protein (UPF0276 family)
MKTPTQLSGIGLRAQHHAELLERRPPLGWLEVHSENHFARGGVQRKVLDEVRSLYPLSLHGVGLSLGSTDPLDELHLNALKRLVRDFDGRFVNDLLPLPYTEEALRHTAHRVRAVQNVLGRQILMENVSSYLQFSGAQLTEWEFLAALVAESGCAILLDVNNVYVNAMNHGFDPQVYLNFIPSSAVREIHLAGHSATRIGTREVLIDTHGTAVCAAVWDLYGAALNRFGPVPTLIEWDTDLPSLDVLIAEAQKIDRHREVRCADAA